MSGLNITERRMPQDGRAKIVVGGAEIDLRVATMPTMGGESAVVRLLRKGSGFVAINQVGLSAADETKLRHTLDAPFGMLIVTGPTGSGKTTTLAASLAVINQTSRKILTIEDPVEYQIPGINQTQVHPSIGLTFASALRSFLRQDPDVMMVGEIRDTETAQIAVQAALTGHMILSTLHTNTAAGAVSRLLDMGVEPFLLGSVLTGVLAQRLVRRLCPECRRPFDAVETAPEALRPLLARQGVDRLYHAVGCARCGGSGYSGRIALLEFLRIDSAVERLILKRADTREILAAAEQGGMRSLAADGVAKAAAGLTTIEEVLRVASGEA
jgi:general secretion pathway protein E